jgi:hypothetical protein
MPGRHDYSRNTMLQDLYKRAMVLGKDNTSVGLRWVVVVFVRKYCHEWPEHARHDRYSQWFSCDNQ